MSAFREVVASEWTKVWSARSTRWTLVGATATMPLMAVFVALSDSIQPDDTVLGGSLTASPVVQMVAAAFGALVMSVEHTTGQIRTTLAAVPRRRLLLAAKTTVVVAALLVATVPAASAAVGIGSVLLGDEHPTGSPFPALLGVGAHLALAGLLGLALGTLLRHSAGAIAALVAATLVPSLIGPLFGDWQRWVGGASPTPALEKMTQTSDAAPELVGSLGAWPSLVVVAGLIAVVLGWAGARFDARDA